MLMYSSLHIMQWFSNCIDVSPRKSDEKFSIFTFSWIKTTVAYTRLEVIARTRYCTTSYRLVQRQTDLLLCTINCFLRWACPQNMAVGNLQFYYTLYLCNSPPGRWSFRNNGAWICLPDFVILTFAIPIFCLHLSPIPPRGYSYLRWVHMSDPKPRPPSYKQTREDAFATYV